jgi:hypothetical protein
MNKFFIFISAPESITFILLKKHGMNIRNIHWKCFDVSPYAGSSSISNYLAAAGGRGGATVQFKRLIATTCLRRIEILLTSENFGHIDLEKRVFSEGGSRIFLSQITFQAPPPEGDEDLRRFRSARFSFLVDPAQTSSSDDAHFPLRPPP